ncbi:methionyl-tRNA formyltransferase [bacterium]|nr:methionyl-tRNA formyltransferase [bacterium]
MPTTVRKPIEHSALRVVFMGTPDFAVPSLNALVAAGIRPVAVVTGPDKPRGRGQKLSPTAVKQAALDLGVQTILQPEDVKQPDFATAIGALNADIIVVVAFRILPQAVFEAASIGTFNLHGSLLPRYRGAAPINRAIMAGDTETGVTTFLLQQKVDTGNVLIKRSMSIGPNETAGEVHDRMMELGASVVLDTVLLLASGSYQPIPQDNNLATPAPKIFKEDGLIDFSFPASRVHDHIRGLSPYPGAYTFLDGVQLKVLETRVSSPDLDAHQTANPETVSPGQVVQSNGVLIVSCGSGLIELKVVQLAGKRAMPVADYLRGSTIPLGTMLGTNLGSK